MAKDFVPWSKEKCARVAARNAALRETTDRAVLAGIAAAHRGEDIAAAVKATMPTAEQPAATTGIPDFDALLAPRRIRVDGWTVTMQRDFIRTLAETGCVSHAAKAAGVSRNTAYAMRHRAAHATFAVAWDVAIQIGRKRLLDIAMERAIEGKQVPVWYRGEQVVTRHVFNDRLLTFLIQRPPEPAHPTLTPYELGALFPQMIETIDVLLPHPIAARMAQEDAAAKAAEEDGF